MTAALTSEAVAQRLLALLQPASVSVAEDDPLFQSMLRHGMINGSACDLMIWRDADWNRPPPALEHAARVLAMPALDCSLGEFIEQAGHQGLTPVLSHDLSFAGRDAMMLERMPRTTDPATAALIAELLRLRLQMQKRGSELAAARRSASFTAERERHTRREANLVHRTLAGQLAATEAALNVTRQQRDLLLASTSWRMTAPLRRMINLVRKKTPQSASGTSEGVRAEGYAAWVEKHDTLSESDRAAIRDHVRLLSHRPLISVIMPVYDTPEASLREAIGSVRAQLYPDWELCIADDASPSPHVAQVLAEFAGMDERIKVVTRVRNGHISAATNSAFGIAQGSYLALMDHDDILPMQALYRVAVELSEHPDADILYSDEDQIGPDGARALPYFKPDWNIELMLGHNMISHLGIYRRSLVERLGGMREGFEGSQDYDLSLRAAVAAGPERIRHIPAILYHWRQHADTFSKLREDVCVDAARRAIGDTLAQMGAAAEGAIVGPAPIASWTRVTWQIPQPAPLVSIIVPTRDNAEMLRQCIDGVLRRTEYAPLEIIIADNNSTEPETHELFAELAAHRSVRVMPFPGPFNYSAINNEAVRQSSGELVCLMNNDIDPINVGWLTEMVAQACRPEIGAVGARLLYPDNRVQHAGVVLGVGTFDNGPGVAGHYGLHENSDSYGYFGASVLVHEVSAVSAACMVLRREVWTRAGGLDAENLPVAFNDVDLCLRIRRLGLRNLWTPHAELYHHESASRGDDLAPQHRERFAGECRFMRDAWAPVLDADPFYNPNFSRMDGLFRLGIPPTRPWEVAGEHTPA